MKRRWLTVIVLTMTIALAASTIILAFLNRKAPDIWAIFEPLTWAGAVVASCVGVLLATRRPRNGVGWVLLVIGLTGQTASLFTLWGIYGLETNPDVSGGARALWTGL